MTSPEHAPDLVEIEGRMRALRLHDFASALAWARAEIEGLKAQLAQADADEDEAHEISKRDGYEDAIQDLDLATGGDGEFKGSTLPGGTVDVPTMKARIIARFADLEAQLASERARVAELRSKFRDEAEAHSIALRSLQEIASNGAPWCEEGHVFAVETAARALNQPEAGK